jgi:hypothetical protein
LQYPNKRLKLEIGLVVIKRTIMLLPFVSVLSPSIIWD